jgi:hypothetical protein
MKLEGYGTGWPVPSETLTPDNQSQRGWRHGLSSRGLPSKLKPTGPETLIPALGRLRQEDLKFKASLDYTVRPCLKTKDRTHSHCIYLSQCDEKL